jgi:N-methylhydantoinase A/oxoprolinase/acetone carboxylase beta subunit
MTGTGWVDGVPQEHVFETTIAGITIQAPQLDINTVAAGIYFLFCSLFSH